MAYQLMAVTRRREGVEPAGICVRMGAYYYITPSTVRDSCLREFNELSRRGAMCNLEREDPKPFSFQELTDAQRNLTALQMEKYQLLAASDKGSCVFRLDGSLYSLIGIGDEAEARMITTKKMMEILRRKGYESFLGMNRSFETFDRLKCAVIEIAGGKRRNRAT